MSVSESFVVLGRMFCRLKYLIIFLVAAFIFYLLNGFIINLKNISSFYSIFGFFGSIKFLFILSLKFVQGVELFTAVATLLLSILFGVLISLLFYRIEIVSLGKLGVLGWLGVFLGAAAPGCAACGIGLVSLLGLSSAIAVLPFKGYEIAVIALIMLLHAIFHISGKLYNPVCELDFNAKFNTVKGGKKYGRKSKVKKRRAA